MQEIIIKSIWLMLPAAISNGAPVLFKWLPLFNKPVDFGLKLFGRPLFGANKTYRGFIVGILVAILVVYIQKFLYPYMSAYSIIDYSSINVFYVGFLFGFGALFGDIVASFFKRRVNVKSGKPWPPFDQIDWVLGALLLVSIYQALSWEIWLSSILVLGILHPVVNLTGYYLGIKKTKF